MPDPGDSLTDKRILESYKDLIHLNNANNGLSSSLRNIYDGAGNPLPIKVSRSQASVTAPVKLLGGTIQNSTLNRPSTWDQEGGVGVKIRIPNFNNVRLSWGRFSNSAYGKQFRKITNVTTTTSTVALNFMDISDFVVLDVQANITSFSIGVFTDITIDVLKRSVGRDIHVLINPNGHTIEMVPPPIDFGRLPESWSGVRWSDNNTGYPSSVSGHFGVGNVNPCLARLVYFDKVLLASEPELVDSGSIGSALWIGSVVGANLKT